MRDYYRKDTVSNRNNRLFIVSFSFLSIVDLAAVLFAHTQPGLTRAFAYPWLAEALKPLLLLALYRRVRAYARRFGYVLRATAPVMLVLLVFVVYFATAGFFLFAGSPEGSLSFGSLWDGFYTLFITVTTSNFPNVMLPAYGINRIAAAFFIGYELVGLYLLTNLLLANIYTSYQARTEQLMDDKDEART